MDTFDVLMVLNFFDVLVFDVVIFVVLTFPRSYDTSDLEPKYK
jgi:hypothetical protein